MFLGEPSATQADLHFRIFGFPVRVHPYFWLVSLFMGAGGFGGGQGVDPMDVFVWVAVVFVSILIHELGHATMQRIYGGHPWITLYAFGGLASCSDGPRSAGRRILILLAGPGAGFVLAAIVVALLKLSGNDVGFGKFNSLIDAGWLERGHTIQPLGPFGVHFNSLRSPVINQVVAKVLEVNIMWGLVNLLPVFPLDGGQISRELFNWYNPRFGTTSALQLSAGTAVLIAAYALLNQRFYIALMFGYLAYSNFQTLQFNQNRWR